MNIGIYNDEKRKTCFGNINHNEKKHLWYDTVVNIHRLLPLGEITMLTYIHEKFEKKIQEKNILLEL